MIASLVLVMQDLNKPSSIEDLVKCSDLPEDVINKSLQVLQKSNLIFETPELNYDFCTDMDALAKEISIYL